jgi:CRP-like cAMP-binding protein
MDAQTPLTTVEKAALLTEVDLFREAPSDGLADLAARMEESWHAPGDVLLEPGAADARLCVIIAGTARITRGDDVIGEIGRGDAFGVLAALGLEHDETVTALASCRTLSIAPDDYLDVLADSPAFALSNLRALGRRLLTVCVCETSLSARRRTDDGGTP